MSENCLPPSLDEVPLTKGSFKNVLKDEAEVQASFEATYTDPRRLEDRAYWSKDDDSYVFIKNQRRLKIPAIFIQSLRRQLEIALERSYAEYVFYPDMGHAHLLIPRDQDPMTTGGDEHFEDLIGHPELKFLYHTAELFLLRENITGPLLGNDWWKWRYFSRNLLGDNQGGESLHVLFANNEAYNTVRELPEHQERARVYISANQNGCFSFTQKGRSVNFDLRLE